MKFTNDPKKTFYFFIFAVLAILSFFIIQNYLTKKGFSRQNTNSEIVQIQTQSTSDEIDAIEKDLGNTDVEGLVKELDPIEKELDAAI